MPLISARLDRTDAKASWCFELPKGIELRALKRWEWKPLLPIKQMNDPSIKRAKNVKDWRYENMRAIHAAERLRAFKHFFMCISCSSSFQPSHVNFFPGESNVSTGLLFTVSALLASKLWSGSFRNSCLFFHVTWLSANFSAYAGGGGGSVILVIKYAVDASAMP